MDKCTTKQIENETKIVDKTRTKRTRRGIGKKGKERREQDNCLKVFSTNCAGILSKISSLKAQVKHTNANIVTLQETHCRTKGKIQIDGYVSFEAIWG